MPRIFAKPLFYINPIWIASSAEPRHRAPRRFPLRFSRLSSSVRPCYATSGRIPCPRGRLDHQPAPTPGHPGVSPGEIGSLAAAGRGGFWPRARANGDCLERRKDHRTRTANIGASIVTQYLAIRTGQFEGIWTLAHSAAQHWFQNSRLYRGWAQRTPAH